MLQKHFKVINTKQLSITEVIYVTYKCVNSYNFCCDIRGKIELKTCRHWYWNKFVLRNSNEL